MRCCHNGSDQIDSHWGIYAFYELWSPTSKLEVKSSFSLNTWHGATVNRNIPNPLLSKMTQEILVLCQHSSWVVKPTTNCSRFWVIFENPKNSRQIIGTSCRSIFHAPESSQMPYKAKVQKIIDFTNQIKNPLELCLVVGRRLPRILNPHWVKYFIFYGLGVTCTVYYFGI